MLVEAALCLAKEEKLLSQDGGFFPPAEGLGNRLLHRITETGTSFQVRLESGRSETTS